MMADSNDLDRLLDDQPVDYDIFLQGSQCTPDPLAELAPPSRQTPLPLLRLADWEEGRRYDRDHPICIHYDIRWKVSQYVGQRKRASEVWKRDEPDVVLAPSDLWERSLDVKIHDFAREKMGENTYEREQANISISVKNTRGLGLKEQYHKGPIEWGRIDDHLATLGDLFENGKSIILDIDISFREIVRHSAPAEKKGKKRTATERQRDRLEAEAAVWSDVYKKLRCDARNCKSGPHCAVDAQGAHLALIPFYIEQIVEHVQQGGDFEGPRDIPPRIWQALHKNAAQAAACKPGQVLASSQATGGSSVHPESTTPAPLSPVTLCGKWDDLLRQYDAYLTSQVDGLDWKKALRNASVIARKLFLELSFCHAHQKWAREKLIAAGVPAPIADQWTGNIKSFDQQKKADSP